MEISHTPKVVKSSNRGAAPGERRGGRKAGTPNKATGEVREIAKAYGPAAIEAAARLAGLVTVEVDGKTIPDGMAESEQARLTALGIILDRAYGKAQQAIVGDPDAPIHVSVTRIELVAADGDSTH